MYFPSSELPFLFVNFPSSRCHSRSIAVEVASRSANIVRKSHRRQSVSLPEENKSDRVSLLDIFLYYPKKTVLTTYAML